MVLAKHANRKNPVNPVNPVKKTQIGIEKLEIIPKHLIRYLYFIKKND